MGRKTGGKAAEGVIELIQGTDDEGEEVYAYISIPLADYPIYREISASGEIFDPTQFGTLLAHGRGEPPPSLARKLAAKYKLPPEFAAIMTEER